MVSSGNSCGRLWIVSYGDDFSCCSCSSSSSGGISSSYYWIMWVLVYVVLFCRLEFSFTYLVLTTLLAHSHFSSYINLLLFLYFSSLSVCICIGLDNVAHDPIESNGTGAASSSIMDELTRYLEG